jgi:hypothetical protein
MFVAIGQTMDAWTETLALCGHPGCLQDCHIQYSSDNRDCLRPPNRGEKQEADMIGLHWMVFRSSMGDSKNNWIPG